MLCDKKDCTGCFACPNICPKNAITIMKDNYGFVYPEIDSKKCVHCKLCEKVCYYNNELKIHKIKKCYAARAKDINIYKTTSSGGIATIISKHIIKHGGVVYGAAHIQNGYVKHIRIDNEKELEQLKGSKYVQSMIEDAFRKVKKDLESNNPVLFIGTPCQINALKLFLRKSWDNLYTIDLICHGVPSSQFLEDQIKLKFNKNEKIKKISFRGQKQFFLVLESNNKIVEEPSYKNLYYYGFLNNFIYRENCYSCKFARSERTGDITLGDFWGAPSNIKFSHLDGLNCVLINTKTGFDLFNNIKTEKFYKQEDITTAINGNGQLQHPSIKSNRRQIFMEEYPSLGFKQSCINAFGLKYKINLIKGYIKSFFKSNKIIYQIYKKIKH